MALAVVSYGADGVSLVKTGKSTTDHMVSMASKSDCAAWRLIRGQKMCREREDGHDPYDVNYDEPFRSVSEGGAVQYGPPLRAAADAPVSSWDVAAYKPAPAAPASTPTTAVADVAPPAPVVVPSPPAKAKKAKQPVLTAKKSPSRGPVATPL